MDDLYSFLFFAAIMIMMVFQNSKKKSRRAKQKTPSISPPDIPSKQAQKEINEKRTYDYMMAKPQSESKNASTTIIYTEPEFIKKEVLSQPELNMNDMNNIYQEYLKQKETHQQIKTADYIQEAEIKTDDTKKIQIDIAHEHIMNAIVYAQVLEMPKSAHYMKRYGIKRIIHKN